MCQDKAYAFHLFSRREIFIEVVHRWMPSLKSSPIVGSIRLRFFKPPPWPWSFPGASEPLPSGSRKRSRIAFPLLFLFPTTRRATENVSFLAPAEMATFFTSTSGRHPRPVLLHQFRFKTAFICRRGVPTRYCPPRFADRRQVFPHSRYPDRISRSCVPSHICASTMRRMVFPTVEDVGRGCRRTSHS